MNLYDTSTTDDTRERLTQGQKDSAGKQWYKDRIDGLIKRSYSNKYSALPEKVSRYKSQRVNYDLFNNIINAADFNYICNPFGSEVGSLPANFTNRDIVSSKIKVLLGMESDMPFQWKVAAVNEEATTRREEEEFGQIRDFVVNTILQPVREQIAREEQEASQGRQLTPDEMNKLQQQLADELQTRTPDEVRRYMAREHQDPAEALIHQLLEYLIKKERIPQKFNKGWKHAMISAEEVFWIGIVNGEPVLKVVNPLWFDCDRNEDLDYHEDGQWATCEYRWTPTQVIKFFGSELTPKQIDDIYSYYNNPTSVWDADFDFLPYYEHETYTLRVIHANWISLRKIGFLTYLDPMTGRPEQKIVPDWYKMDEEAGDLTLEWEWIPEAHEGWKIAADIYVNLRPVPGQHRDMDNLYNSKLSYYGACIDNLNSIPTSPMDRAKSYQYFYDIIMYRIELLIASDKGKILMMNINAIPKSSGIDVAKFLYFLEANKMGFFNPNEEGNRGDPTAGAMAKEIDMSLASDIFKYVQLAEYIEKRCGESIGVPKSMEGGAAPNEPVSNNRQNMVQASYILRPYWDIHNNVKANVLQALVDTAKVAYAGGKKRKLTYILDDLSLAQLEIDTELLESSTYGLFVSNSSNAYDAKQLILNLAQAALQNQRADISDIIKVMRSESLQEGEELLEAAQMKKDEQLQMQQRQASEAQAKEAELQRAWSEQHEEKLHQNKLEEIRVKGDIDLQKQIILSMGFNEDKDVDDDGVPDVFELYKEGLKAKFTAAKQALDEAKFEHQKQVDSTKARQTDKKLAIDNKKANQRPSSSK